MKIYNRGKKNLELNLASGEYNVPPRTWSKDLPRSDYDKDTHGQLQNLATQHPALIDIDFTEPVQTAPVTAPVVESSLNKRSQKVTE